MPKGTMPQAMIQKKGYSPAWSPAGTKSFTPAWAAKWTIAGGQIVFPAISNKRDRGNDIITANNIDAAAIGQGFE